MTSADTDITAPFPYVGALAYMDSLSGLIPCRVDWVDADGVGVGIRITADRKAYRKGEVLHALRRYVVARTAVHVVGGQYRIRG